MVLKNPFTDEGVNERKRGDSYVVRKISMLDARSYLKTEKMYSQMLYYTSFQHSVYGCTNVCRWFDNAEFSFGMHPSCRRFEAPWCFDTGLVNFERGIWSITRVEWSLQNYPRMIFNMKISD